MNRPNDSQGTLGKLFGGLVRGARKILGLEDKGKPFEPYTVSSTEFAPGEMPERLVITQRLSARDRQLPVDVFKVKQKLGRAYFTRGLSKRTRAARVRTLKRDELVIARGMGWL